MKLNFLLFLSLLFFCCNNKIKESKELRWLEDIPFEEKKDNKDFIICNGEENIYQYFNVGNNLEIVGDKPYIMSHFKHGYDSTEIPKESGLIRIRFIVNCEGGTDRFRVLESDLNYKEKKFDKKISQSILQLTKSLVGWKQKIRRGIPIDYYQYLVFRIVDGEIIKILP